MNKLILLLILLVGTILQANNFPTKALLTANGKPTFVENELVVKFHPKVPQHAIDKFNKTHGASIIKEYPLGITQLRLPNNASPKAKANVYNKNPNVQFAHPNFIAYATHVPNDYFYITVPRHWNFDNPTYGGIQMEQAWDRGNAGNGVIVAVLDTGVAYEDYDEDPNTPGYEYLQAPEFALTTFVSPADYINSETHANDDNGHGTHVTGTIAQSTNNSTGTAGIAYNATIMPVKVLDAQGSGTSLDIMEGMYHSILFGADVMNMSLSFGSMEGTIEAMDYYIDMAYNDGIAIVAATGNDYFTNFVSYPANNPQVIAVGATDYYENVTAYSNKGPEVEITAPGGDNSQNLTSVGYGSYGGILQQSIYSDDPTSFNYFYYMGTSMATPHVSATIALIKEVNPSLTVDQIRTILQNSAEDHGPAGHDNSYGYGILDANKAITQANNSQPNNSPTAEIGGDTSGTEDIAVNFESLSTDPDLDPLTYSWNIQGQIYTEENPTHIFAWGGDFPISLTVSDGRGGTDTANSTISILEVDNPTIINIGGPYSGDVGEEIQFDASATSDYDNEDGTTLNDQDFTYHWDFGDGNTAIGIQVTNTYDIEDEYTVKLTIKEDGIVIVEDTTLVSITDNQTSTTIEQVALADIFVAGNVSGTYINTHSLNDGASQMITERLSGGKPRNRYSYLEHQWEFNIQSGDQVSLSINASNTNTGETFTFAYSLDGNSFTNIVNNNASLPNNFNGTLYIRVKDDTRIAGNKDLHSITVDQILITTHIDEPATTVPIAPTNLLANAISDSQVSLTWTDNSDDENSFKIERKLNSESTWTEIATTSANATDYEDIGLTALTTYDYRVFANNNIGKSTTSTNIEIVTTLDAPNILLSAQKNTVKGVKHVILSWDNNSDAFDIFRDDKDIGDSSKGTYDDSLGKKVNPSYKYKVCYKTSPEICSNEITITY